VASQSAVLQSSPVMTSRISIISSNSLQRMAKLKPVKQ